MPKGLLFWILMLMWLFLGVWSSWPLEGRAYLMLGGTLLEFVLFLLLGWKVYGAPLQ